MVAMYHGCDFDLQNQIPIKVDHLIRKDEPHMIHHKILYIKLVLYVLTSQKKK